MVGGGVVVLLSRMAGIGSGWRLRRLGGYGVDLVGITRRCGGGLSGRRF